MIYDLDCDVVVCRRNGHHLYSTEGPRKSSRTQLVTYASRYEVHIMVAHIRPQEDYVERNLLAGSSPRSILIGHDLVKRCQILFYVYSYA